MYHYHCCGHWPAYFHGHAGYHHPYHYFVPPVPYTAAAVWPTWTEAKHHCTCSPPHIQVVPQIETVEPPTSPRTILIGGTRDVRLTLEYMAVDGASAPDVNVTITAPSGVKSTWGVSPVPSGYHVKDDLATVAPGTKVEIQVTETVARLRWCEFITR